MIHLKPKKIQKFRKLRLFKIISVLKFHHNKILNLFPIARFAITAIMAPIINPLACANVSLLRDFASSLMVQKKNKIKRAVPIPLKNLRQAIERYIKATLEIPQAPFLRTQQAIPSKKDITINDANINDFE